MSEISISDAAFAGVRAVRRRPATLVFWYVLAVLIAVGMMAAMTALMGPAMAEMQAIQKAGPGATDPTAALAAAGKMFGGVIMMLPVYLIIGAITTCAANRAILRPNDTTPGYVRLGGDEFRMMVVLLVIGLIMSLVYFVGFAVAAIVGVMVTGVSAAGAANAAKLLPAILVGFSPFLAFMIFLGVRLSLAAAQTLDTRSINIFGSWTLTRGHAGKVFLVYLINGLIFGCVYFGVLILVAALARALGAPNTGLMMRPDMTAMANVFNGPMIVYFLGTGIISTSAMVLMTATGGALYQQITGRGDEAEAF